MCATILHKVEMENRGGPGTGASSAMPVPRAVKRIISPLCCCLPISQETMVLALLTSQGYPAKSHGYNMRTKGLIIELWLIMPSHTSVIDDDAILIAQKSKVFILDFNNLSKDIDIL